MAASPLHNRAYSTRDVARLSSVSEWYVRSCAREGIIDGGRSDAPKTHFKFDFEAVLILRMAGRLLTQGATPAQARRILKQVKEQIPNGRVTSAVIENVGESFIAQTHGMRWEPESGQAFLPMGLESDGTPSEPVLPISPSCERMRLAQTALERDPMHARALYLQVLADDPEHIDAYIQLGHWYLDAGDLEKAAAYFRQALRIQPTHNDVHFHLAMAYHDMGMQHEAIGAYRATLDLAPEHAEAHFNLAALLEETGASHAALQHLHAYRLLTGKKPSL